MRSRTLWAVAGLCVALVFAAHAYADDSVAPTVKAADLVKQGKPDRAIAPLTAYLAKTPNNSSALLLRGATYAQLGKPAEAVADYLAALAIDPDLEDVPAQPLAKTDCTRHELAGPVHTTQTTYQSLKRQLDGSIDTSQTAVGSATYDRTCTLVESTQDTPDFVDDQHPQRLDATTVLLRSNMGDKRVRERYDAAGNRIEAWTTTAKDGAFVGHSAYRYDADGRVVRVDSFGPDGKADGFTTFARDSAGHVTQEVIQFGDGRSVTETYTYEFDRHGNWTKEYESGNDPDSGVTDVVPTGILFRTITYYPA